MGIYINHVYEGRRVVAIAVQPHGDEDGELIFGIFHEWFMDPDAKVPYGLIEDDEGEMWYIRFVDIKFIDEDEDEDEDEETESDEEDFIEETEDRKDNKEVSE